MVTQDEHKHPIRLAVKALLMLICCERKTLLNG
jgi:hypothetical protein